MISGHTKGYSHSCRQLDIQTWVISWLTDYYPKGVSWRATRRISRSTDLQGAKRFCEKWGLEFKNTRQPIKELT